MEKERIGGDDGRLQPQHRRNCQVLSFHDVIVMPIGATVPPVG